jgi:hypothetical protein
MGVGFMAGIIFAAGAASFGSTQSGEWNDEPG